jgi:hypothetical protein
VPSTTVPSTTFPSTTTVMPSSDPVRTCPIGMTIC